MMTRRFWLIWAAVWVIFVGFCVLDPRVGAMGAQHYVIGTGADDGSQRYGYGVDATGRVAIENQSVIESERQSPMFRFENVQLGQGETITSAMVTLYDDFGQYVGADWRIEAGGCSDLQVHPDIYGRPYLAAQVRWYTAGLVRGYLTSPNLASLINAATAQPTWHKGDSACLALIAEPGNYIRYPGDSGIQAGFDPRAFESGFPATLDLS